MLGPFDFKLQYYSIILICKMASRTFQIPMSENSGQTMKRPISASDFQRDNKTIYPIFKLKMLIFSAIFIFLFFSQIFVVLCQRFIYLFARTSPKLMTTKPKPIQIIKDRLFWVSDVSPPKNLTKAFYFNIDDDLQYQPFYLDFGPLNLGKTWKYVTELEKLLAHPDYKKNQIYHYTSNVPQKAANAAFLMGAFELIVLGLSAQKAFQPFKNVALKVFRDASYNNACSYKCTLLDCLRGLDYAIKLKWFDHKKFNLNEYEHYEKVQNGDLNWIVPNKFVAFSSPYDKPVDKYGNRVFTPADYVPVFKKLGVTMVIRLNNHTYEAKGFTKQGIKHHDLIFPDGTPPPMDIVDKFLEIVQNQPGAVAVHCKAGLGRTGSLIACYSMKHYRYSAPDFIGWIRIARPGSILGPQQHFLIQMEKKMFDRSDSSPIWKAIKGQVQEKTTLDKLNNLSIKSFEMNDKQKEIILNGDYGQGQNLVQAKIKQQMMKNGSYGLSSGSNAGKQKRSSSKASSKNSTSPGSPHVIGQVIQAKKQQKKSKF